MNPTIDTLTSMESFFAQYGILLLSFLLIVYAITAIILLSLLNKRERQLVEGSVDGTAFTKKCDSLLDEIVTLRTKIKGVGTIKEKDFDECLRTLEKKVIIHKLNS